MDLRRLENFLAVVEHGGVTAAAGELHVAQPSLSQSIRSLERELGTTLFERTGRGLTLTAAGHALVGPARQVLHSLQVARGAVADVVELSAGWLDVAAHNLLAVDPVAPTLAAFKQRHPGVPVRVHAPRDEDEMIRLLLDGRCELAVTHLPVQRTGLEVLRLGAQEMWVLLPPGAPEQAELPDPLPVKALHGMALVDSTRGFEAARSAVRQVLRADGVPMFRTVLCRHREAIVPLVLAGAGAAFTNRWYADVAADAGAVVRRLDPPVHCDYGVLYRTGAMSPAARGFVESLTSCTSDESY